MNHQILRMKRLEKMGRAPGNVSGGAFLMPQNTMPNVHGRNERRRDCGLTRARKKLRWKSRMLVLWGTRLPY